MNPADDIHQEDSYTAQTLGERIMLLMHRRGLKQKSLAALADVHPNTVGNYLHNRVKNAEIEVIERLAQALGTTSEVLVEGMVQSVVSLQLKGTTRVLLQSTSQLPLMAVVKSPEPPTRPSVVRGIDQGKRSKASSPLHARSSPRKR